MPELHHDLVPAGSGHPEVRRFLAVKHNRAPGRGLVGLEGFWMIRAAADRGAAVETVLVCPEMMRGDDGRRLVARLAGQGASALQVSRRTLLRIAEREGPDGLAALAQLPEVRLDQLRPGPTALVLVLDGAELAGNVGALVRCADAVGATGVIMTDHRVRLAHPLLVKASMGTIFSVPICTTDEADAAAWLRKEGFHLVAADPGATTSYRLADYPARVAIVLGAERRGLGPFWRRAADQTVAIPMLGTADSLNVGHAGALLLYEWLHRHQLLGGGQ